MKSVARTEALGHRLAVNGLTGPQLRRSRLTEAARPGLQDRSPRSGLLSLAARVDVVRPSNWHHPGPAQVFGPRGAIYLVPDHDVVVFTLGLLPRDPAQIERLRHLAQIVYRVLDDGPIRQTDLVAALPEIDDSRELRWASTLGAARHELARRFLRHIRPATVADRQWWLNGSRADAKMTIEAMADDLEGILVDGHRCLGTAPFVSVDPDPEAVLLLPPTIPTSTGEPTASCCRIPPPGSFSGRRPRLPERWLSARRSQAPGDDATPPSRSPPGATSNLNIGKPPNWSPTTGRSVKALQPSRGIRRCRYGALALRP